jgi:cytochrome c553
MKNSLAAGLILALCLSACGKKEEAATPEQAPATATQAPAPAAAAFDAATTYKTVCATCHGVSGQGVAAFPKLAGLTPEAVKAKLNDYKAGKQMGPQTAVMAPNATNLGDSDIDAMAAYVATLK